jgi:uncharacterized protein (TIGR02466 family)
MNDTLQLLFATPIVISDIPEIPQADHNYLLNAEYHKEAGSYEQFEKTKNTYILRGWKSDLNTWIEEQINIFAESALATRDKLKITQSWCLRHQDSVQNVYTHSHPNSIISGAYYLDAPEGTANIRFSKEEALYSPFIRWENDDELLNQQPWNWSWHEIPVQTGRLVLFPSYLKHGVTGNGINKNTRCVLSFNTWFNGPFGSADNLRALGD